MSCLRISCFCYTFGWLSVWLNWFCALKVCFSFVSHVCQNSGASKVLSSFYVMNLLRKVVQQLYVPWVFIGKKVYSKANISIMIQSLTYCCVSSRVFTTRCALNACDLIKESSLLMKNCEWVRHCLWAVLYPIHTHNNNT